MDGCLKRLTICFFLFPFLAHADKVNNEWYSPVRTLCMGNAAVGLADEPEAAMFYNPAALAKFKKPSFTYFNPALEMGVADFTLNNSGLLLGKNTTLKQIQPEEAKHPKKASSLGFSTYPNFQAQNFAFGIAIRASANSYMDNGTLYYHSQYLLVPTLGLSAGLLSGRLKLGVAVRGVQLTENNKSTTDFSNIGYMTNAGQGLGLAVDAGSQLTMPWAGLPTFAFVARNIGATSFPGASILGLASPAQGKPDIIKTTFDLGFSTQAKFSSSSNLVFDVDYRDLHNATKTATLRKVNLGIEFGLSRFLYIDTGARSGYWSLGFGFRAKKSSLELGTYAEELDASAYHKVQDRRIAMQFGSHF